MKIALVTDTHFGGRNDSIAFDNFFRKFYEEMFFPYLDDNNIKTIMHLGDCFDRRKYINYNTLQSCREYFFDAARKRGIRLFMIPGNHDTYFKNTNSVNSPSLLLKDYDNITLIEKAQEVVFDGTPILYVPWICPENEQETMDTVARSNAQYCFGHFEFKDYDMYRGITNPHGMDASHFHKFRHVVSGHFHHRHTRDNVTYMGNAYEITWADYNDPRGFGVFDTGTGHLSFVNNPFKMFHKLTYDDTNQSEDYISSFDYKSVHGCAVKVIVVAKNNFEMFDRFIDNLYAQDLNDLEILEDFSEFEFSEFDENIDLEDTMSILKDYVNNVETNLDKDRLQTILQTLFIEAQDVT